MKFRIALALTMIIPYASVAVAAPEAEKKVRTLDAITIEGEIDMPQVLFITSRDQQRYSDKNHRKYIKTCQEIGRETVVPARLQPVNKEK